MAIYRENVDRDGAFETVGTVQRDASQTFFFERIDCCQRAIKTGLGRTWSESSEALPPPETIRLATHLRNSREFRRPVCHLIPATCCTGALYSLIRRPGFLTFLLLEAWQGALEGLE